jgi:hypothetical protein
MHRNEVKRSQPKKASRTPVSKSRTAKRSPRPRKS